MGREWLKSGTRALLLAMLTVCGCSGVNRHVEVAAEQGGEMAKAVAVCPNWAGQGHPRLMLNGQQIQSWQENLSPQQREMWQQVVSEIDRLKRAKAPADGRIDRGHGNMLARLAVTARLSGDAELATVAKRYLLDISRHGKVDVDGDLERGHLMWGGAIAYDWLYGDLSEQERADVRAMLAREAAIHYEQTTTGRGYWRNQYLQNHGHVNIGGLAFAAAALYGEDPRAPQWLQLAHEFFVETFRWSNPDGTSIEGLSYGVYALEFCLRYAELARQVHGVDYSNCPWFANMSLYVMHSTLPVMTRDEWAMDFGDSPRAGNSHLPTHSLAWIAATRRDPVAQGAGKMLRDLHGHPGHDAWQTVLWYDERVPAVGREDLPTFHHFADTGQVMMRTDWSADAMLVGLHCGPWLGHNAWRRAKWDLGAAHAHPDINSFQLFANGEWLLIDPGYTYRKRTSNHSTMLIDGVGQLGEDVTWFAAEDAMRHDHYARISRTETTADYDYVMGDATGTYHPGLGLKRYVRHWLFLKPARTLVVIDDVATAPTGYYRAWTREEVQFAGMKVEDPQREFLMPTQADRRGRVWFDYDGPCGTFDIDVDYFDNAPGQGHYVLAVAGKVVAAWTHDVQETDLHTRTIPGVKIHEGDRVELRGEPFGEPGKFIKLVVSSRSQLRAQPHHVELLLHAPPAAKVAPANVRSENAVGYTVDAGQAGLDVWATGPGLISSCCEYNVLQGSRIKRTQRIVLSPQLQQRRGEDAAVVVTVLRPRTSQASSLRWIEAATDAADRSTKVRIEDGSGAWDAEISLEDGRVQVTRRERP